MQHASDDRLTTGVPGFDEVLAGGPIRGSTMLLVGPPGSGKTLCASQIAFHRASAGEQVLYVTLLNESVERLINHLQTMDFFDEDKIPSQIYFMGAYAEARDRGLEALVSLIGRHVRQHGAELVIFDGLTIAESLSGDTLRFQSFLYELSAALQMSRCTGIFLAARNASSATPEQHLLDLVVRLRDEPVGMGAARDLQVLKSRGGESLRGRHAFEIDARGLVVYPRLEARVAARRESADDGVHGRKRFGNAALDAMLGGGLPAGSATVLAGAPGGGKTLLGLHFLSEGAGHGERGLYFGFSEGPAQLLEKAAGVGLDLEGPVQQGHVTLRWQPSFERPLDALAGALLDALDATGSTRVVIDGAFGFRRSATDPSREATFFPALTLALRRRGITALLTEELSLYSSEIDIGLDGLSAVVDNVLLLRYIELDGALRRLLSILKLRDSAYDSALRELVITRAGIDVEATFAPAEHLLAGSPSMPARPLEHRGSGPPQ